MRANNKKESTFRGEVTAEGLRHPVLRTRTDAESVGAIPHQPGEPLQFRADVLLNEGTNRPSVLLKLANIKGNSHLKKCFSNIQQMLSMNTYLGTIDFFLILTFLIGQFFFVSLCMFSDYASHVFIFYRQSTQKSEIPAKSTTHR